MAEEEVPCNIEKALNGIVKTTDKSGDMKKEQNLLIYENVCYLKKSVC